MLHGQRSWDTDKVRQCIHADDFQDIIHIRPLQYARIDKPVWPLSTTGQYTVKTGYHLLHRHLSLQQAPSSSNIHTTKHLCRRLWNFSLPPKIKLFWWKVLHNGLPTLVNLRIRNTLVDPTCLLCHEAEETVEHLFLHCKISREAWTLLVPDAYSVDHLSVGNLVYHLWRNDTKGSSPLTAFIGWNIWKARNNATFNNEPVIIPHILDKASTDHRLWVTSVTPNNPQRDQHHDQPQQTTNTNPNTNLNNLDLSRPRCFVSAHWLSPTDNFNLAWIFYKQSTPTIQGLGSFPATSTRSTATALAIQEACNQILRFGLPGTAILSDDKQLISRINHCLQDRNPLLAEHEELSAQALTSDPVIENICNTAIKTKPRLSFTTISKDQNREASHYAKQSVGSASTYKISWL